MYISNIVGDMKITLLLCGIFNSKTMLNNITFFQILFRVFFKHMILDARRLEELCLQKFVLDVKNKVLPAVPSLPGSL